MSKPDNHLSSSVTTSNATFKQIIPNEASSKDYFINRQKIEHAADAALLSRFINGIEKIPSESEISALKPNQQAIYAKFLQFQNTDTAKKSDDGTVPPAELYALDDSIEMMIPKMNANTEVKAHSFFYRQEKNHDEQMAKFQKNTAEVKPYLRWG